MWVTTSRTFELVRLSAMSINHCSFRFAWSHVVVGVSWSLTCKWYCGHNGIAVGISSTDFPLFTFSPFTTAGQAFTNTQRRSPVVLVQPSISQNAKGIFGFRLEHGRFFADSSSCASARARFPLESPVGVDGEVSLAAADADGIAGSSALSSDPG